MNPENVNRIFRSRRTVAVRQTFRHARLWILPALLVGLALAGTACAQNKGSDATRAGKGPDPVKTAEGAPLIIFTRSGGFAGLREAWQVFSDGRIIFNSARQTNAEIRTTFPDSVDAAVRAIRESGFLETEQADLSNSRCADCFLYSLTLRQGEEAKILRAIETELTPPPLVAALARVGRLFEAAGFPNPYVVAPLQMNDEEKK